MSDEKEKSGMELLICTCQDKKDGLVHPFRPCSDGKYHLEDGAYSLDGINWEKPVVLKGDYDYE